MNIYKVNEEEVLMSVVTNNMKLNLNKAKVTRKDEKWIEQDIIVPDNMPDALKIINVSAFPYISDIENM